VLKVARASLAGGNSAPRTIGAHPRLALDPADIKSRLRVDTLLVSDMHANNETGVLQPVGEIADLLAGTATYFHVDAAQTFGKEVETLRSLPYDFLSVSGHKIYGPKGIGALIARRRGGQKRPITALVGGGGQEMGLRPGTVPVPLVVGLGAAARLASAEHGERKEKAGRVKEEFLRGLAGVEYILNGDRRRTQTHVANICFAGVDSEALMLSLRDVVAISNGSACTSASYSPSHVLKAMGLSDEGVASSVRISWGPGITRIPSEAFVDAVSSLRNVP
jgi:cysteine desulfurase